jgi:hypothetical protein
MTSSALDSKKGEGERERPDETPPVKLTIPLISFGLSDCSLPQWSCLAATEQLFPPIEYSSESRE